MDQDELIRELAAQKASMIAVSTGGPPIDHMNPEYRERRERISDALADLGLPDPNPHSDLWHWYGRWRAGDLPTYQSRREYVAGLIDPLIELIKAPRLLEGPVREETGWPRVDRSLLKIRRSIAAAKNEEDFQEIGLLCRETLISTAQAVYVSEKHPPLDGTIPSATDANRMLESYFAVELAGGVNEDVRRYARAALSLANALTHKRTANSRDAHLCAEATTSVVNVVGIISRLA